MPQVWCRRAQEFSSSSPLLLTWGLVATCFSIDELIHLLLSVGFHPCRSTPSFSPRNAPLHRRCAHRYTDRTMSHQPLLLLLLLALSSFPSRTKKKIYIYRGEDVSNGLESHVKFIVVKVSSSPEPFLPPSTVVCCCVMTFVCRECLILSDFLSPSLLLVF